MTIYLRSLLAWLADLWTALGEQGAPDPLDDPLGDIDDDELERLSW